MSLREKLTKEIFSDLQPEAYFRGIVDGNINGPTKAAVDAICGLIKAALSEDRVVAEPVHINCHNAICSASRSLPVGTPGCVCLNIATPDSAPSGEAVREALTRAANGDLFTQEELGAVHGIATAVYDYLEKVSPQYRMSGAVFTGVDRVIRDLALPLLSQRAQTLLALTAPGASVGEDDFQSRVQPWMTACFGPEISRDKIERNHRFIEEALELVQANGCTAGEAHQLVDYVYGRPVGEIKQEVGGVMVTLAALCLACDLDMHACGETELARVWTKVEQIRAKQAAKPKHSPLPGPSDPTPQDAKPKIVCHAVGGRCLGCDHWEGKSPVCKYAPQDAKVDAGEIEQADCTLCANVESPGFYTGCMAKDGHGNGWTCDGRGHLARLRIGAACNKARNAILKATGDTP